jgi:AcrR family transcriptional regulator
MSSSSSARPAGRDARAELIEGAARLLSEHGPDALTVRRLAAEIGASTMAVYTHFGSMAELRRAIRAEGFERLNRDWRSVGVTDDPVADLTVRGGAYLRFALDNPHLYRAMYYETPTDDEAVASTAEALDPTVQRCIDAGRFTATDPAALVWQLWATTHGVSGGVLSGVLDLPTAQRLLMTLGVNLYVGFGDDRESAQRSIDRASSRIRSGPATDPASTSDARVEI